MQVLYLDVTSDEGLDRLKSLVDVAVKYLADAGIESTDGRGFTPHVTIAKMSKVRHGRRGKQDVCKGIPKVPSPTLATPRWHSFTCSRLICLGLTHILQHPVPSMLSYICLMERRQNSPVVAYIHI